MVSPGFTSTGAVVKVVVTPVMLVFLYTAVVAGNETI